MDSAAEVRVCGTGGGRPKGRSIQRCHCPLSYRISGIRVGKGSIKAPRSSELCPGPRGRCVGCGTLPARSADSSGLYLPVLGRVGTYSYTVPGCAGRPPLVTSGDVTATSFADPSNSLPSPRIANRLADPAHSATGGERRFLFVGRR